MRRPGSGAGALRVTRPAQAVFLGTIVTGGGLRRRRFPAEGFPLGNVTGAEGAGYARTAGLARI